MLSIVKVFRRPFVTLSVCSYNYYQTFQILRLDDETRREETFQRIGDSEILNLDSGDEELEDEGGGEEEEKSGRLPETEVEVDQEQDRSPERGQNNKTLTNR
jgi:hypothetical protein